MKLTFLTLAGIENSTTKRIFYLARELKKKGYEIEFLTFNWLAKKGSSGKGDIEIGGIKIKEIKIKDNLFNIFIKAPIKLFSKIHGEIIILSKPLPPHTIPLLIAKPFLHKSIILDEDDWEGSGGGASYSEFGWFKRTLINFLEEYLIKNSDGVITSSKTLEKRAIYAKAKKVLYLPNVAEINTLDINNKRQDEIKKELRIKDETIFISASSHGSDILTESLMDFLKAFGKVKQNFKIIIAGEGKHTEAIKKLCIGLKIDKKVNFVGFVSEDKLKEYMSISDVAIVAITTKYPYTLYAMSSRPRKMYEAMSLGLPIIGHNAGEIKETLGNTNFLVEEGNEQALIKKIEEIIKTNKGELKKIGEINKEKIKREYNFDNQSNKFIKFINEIV